jgi:hypothetical protein
VDPRVVNKRPTTLQAGYEIYFSLSPRELLELSAYPFITPVHLQYQITGRSAITSDVGPEPG